MDNNKWEIADKWRDGRCEDKPQYQLHCDSNSLKNLQLREGCLAITAVCETPDTDRHRTDLLATDYTSASVVSTQDWTYGVFEVRAALPAGKLLRPVISLTERNGTGGQIDIVSNDQTPGVVISALVTDWSADVEEWYYETNETLQHFHSYTIEWSEWAVDWFLDDSHYLSYNTSKQPFDRPFRLGLTLAVGADETVFPDQSLSYKDYRRWNCSALIVDYVRVYQWVTDGQNVGKSLHSNHTARNSPVSARSVCQAIMSS
ncbi:unnamed protein product, partial [Medioppia subpectinata]